MSDVTVALLEILLKDRSILRSNVDKTRILFKRRPRQTYISSFKDKRHIRGTKAMRAEDLIIDCIVMNATGVRVPSSIIGTAKVRCRFLTKTPLVNYFHRKNAWSDVSTFQKRFLNLFLSLVGKLKF